MAADDDSDLDMSAPLPSLTNSSPYRPEEEMRSAAAANPLQPMAADRDTFSIYQYDTNLRIDLPPLDNSNTEEPNYFAGIKKWEDEREVRTGIS